MAYSEKDLQNGLIERRYFGLDSSGIFKMYYNGEAINFPRQKVAMGKDNKVVISIDMKKFKGLFHLSKVYIRLKFTTAFLKHPVFVYKAKSIKEDGVKEFGTMEKDADGYYKIDITELTKRNLNTKFFLRVETKNCVDLYTLFAYYGLKAQLVVEYYNPNYLFCTKEGEV